jgi:P27 family predicted phage terminase small subunit
MTKRTPRDLQLILGNPGKRPLPDSPKVMVHGMPEPPAFLCAEGLEEWHRVVRPLYEAGLVTPLDAAVLAGYAAAYGRWAQAEKALARQEAEAGGGMVDTTSHGNRIQHVLLGIARRAQTDMLRAAKALGMTPVSRTGIDAVPPPVGDETSQFFP